MNNTFYSLIEEAIKLKNEKSISKLSSELDMDIYHKLNYFLNISKNLIFFLLF